MLCWTLKLKEVLNKRRLSASVPEAAVLPVLLLLVLGILVVLVVLEELVVFEGEIFKRGISLNFFFFSLEFKKKICGVNKIQKVLRTKSKIYLYFGVLHSIMPL